MQSAQGSLVIIGANTPNCQVFWNGQPVVNTGVSIESNPTVQRVILKVQEDPILSEMAANGIIIKRSV